MPSGVSAISTSVPSKSRNSASGFRAASSASGGGGGRSMLLCIAAKARGGNPMGQPPPFCRCGASDHPERAHGLGDADEAGDVGAQDIVAGGAIFVGGRGAIVVDAAHDLRQPLLDRKSTRLNSSH